MLHQVIDIVKTAL